MSLASTNHGTQVQATVTGGGDRREWVRTRHAAIVAELVRMGWAFAAAWVAAISILAHYTRECGWGRAEYNYSLGNIRAFGWSGLFHVLSDHLDYRAYPTLAEGVRGNLALASGGRYAGAWSILRADPANGREWYAALMRAGWHPYSDAALRDYDGVRSRLVEWVGPVPSSAGPGIVGALCVVLGLLLSR